MNLPTSWELRSGVIWATLLLLCASQCLSYFLKTRFSADLGANLPRAVALVIGLGCRSGTR
jgi:hypothetical protein